MTARAHEEKAAAGHSSHSTFAPEQYSLRVEHRNELPLVITGTADEFICRFAAALCTREGGPSQGLEFFKLVRRPVATVAFRVGEFGVLRDSGGDPQRDREGKIGGAPRKIAPALLPDDFEYAANGKELLHFEAVHVEPGENAHEILRHVLEAVISRYGRCCSAAVYRESNSASVGLISALRDRNFHQLASNGSIWFRDLQLAVPPLMSNAHSSTIG